MRHIIQKCIYFQWNITIFIADAPKTYEILIFSILWTPLKPLKYWYQFRGHLRNQRNIQNFLYSLSSVQIFVCPGDLVCWLHGFPGSRYWFSRFSGCEVFKHPRIHKHYCLQPSKYNKLVWVVRLGHADFVVARFSNTRYSKTLLLATDRMYQTCLGSCAWSSIYLYVCIGMVCRFVCIHACM